MSRFAAAVGARWHAGALVATAIVAAGCGQACQSGRLVELEGAVLADAKGNVEPPEGGETVALLPDEPEVTIPDAELVVLAIDRRVPWGRVKAVVESVEAKGAQVAILVSRAGRIRAFVLEDEHKDRARVELLGFPSGTGWKSCVRPRGGDEAKCVAQRAGRFIDGAYTREIVREAVRAYNSRDVLVGVPVSLPWGDAVRLIDGARTCCADEEVRIELVTLDERGAPLKDDDA
jgi:hypothetical protein